MKLSTFACVALSGFAIALPSSSMEVEVDITVKGGNIQDNTPRTFVLPQGQQGTSNQHIIHNSPVYAASVTTIKGSSDWDKFVHQDNDRIVVVNVWAPWRGPCHCMNPVFESLGNLYDADFVTANVDDLVGSVPEMDTIPILPTYIFYKNGVEVQDRLMHADSTARGRAVARVAEPI